MKISTLGTGTIVFSIGLFFFNLTSGQGISEYDRNFITVIFEDISIIISIITMYFVLQNKFEDSSNYKNWRIILIILGVFSAIFNSFFYINSGPLTIPLINYLIFLGYVLILVLILMILVIDKRRIVAEKQNPTQKIIKITEKS